MNWKSDVRLNLMRCKGISENLLDSIELFFEKAFENTYHPQRAWFGIHPTRISLVVGGIYLAAIHKSGDDKGIWLLLDQPNQVNTAINLRPAKSTQRSKNQLTWGHAPTFEAISEFVNNESLWRSYASASKKILSFPISHDKDSIQQKRKKIRLSDFLVIEPNELQEDKFQELVNVALHESQESRRKRLASAHKIPKKIKTISMVFQRNPDVVAEVLSRADGYCEKCKNPAPFIRRTNGSPYLEIHHMKPLAEGGEDTVKNATALCPNCHRKFHHA